MPTSSPFRALARSTSARRHGPEFFLLLSVAFILLLAAAAVPAQPPPSSDGEMRYVEFSPYWNVTPSIQRGETVPRLKRDPGYRERETSKLFRPAAREMRSRRSMRRRCKAWRPVRCASASAR